MARTQTISTKEAEGNNAGNGGIKMVAVQGLDNQFYSIGYESKNKKAPTKAPTKPKVPAACVLYFIPFNPVAIYRIMLVMSIRNAENAVAE